MNSFPIQATLHFVRDDGQRSATMAASVDDALATAVEGERSSDFRAEKITDALGLILEGDDLRRAIDAVR